MRLMNFFKHHSQFYRSLIHAPYNGKFYKIIQEDYNKPIEQTLLFYISMKQNQKSKWDNWYNIYPAFLYFILTRALPPAIWSILFLIISVTFGLSWISLLLFLPIILSSTINFSNMEIPINMGKYRTWYDC